MEPSNENNQEANPSKLSSQEANLVNQVATQPIVPVAPSQSVQSVETVPLQTPVVAPAKKKNVKLFVIIGAALLGLIAIATALWIFVFNSGGVPLREYDGGSYTVLVPESFTEKKSSLFQNNVTFTKKTDISDGEKSSSVEISYTSNGSESREQLIERLDKAYFNDDSNYFKNDDSKTNIKIEKTTKNNNFIRSVSADIMENDKVIGKINLTFIVTEKGMFSITTIALSEDTGLIGSVNNMVNSFKEK